MTDDSGQLHKEGVFITFEGGEGVGKTTHIHFLAEVLTERGYEVICLREPGGTAIGEALRNLVLDIDNKEMADETELFIYEAARAQIVAEIIKPALARSAVVLCDRFTDSTIAYQAYGRGLPEAFIRQANEFACQGLVPDRTILMMCGDTADQGLSRATQHTGADRLESAGIDFHSRVNAGFLDLAKNEPARIRIVESADEKAHTSHAIFKALADIFPWVETSPYSESSFFSRIDAHYYGDKHVSPIASGK